MNEKNVIQALSPVQDPDLKKGLVELGMIKDVVITGTKVGFTLELTTPACPLKEQLRRACTEAVLGVFPNVEVAVNMSAQVTAPAKSTSLPGVRNIIGVASGKGGVGKSTVAVNLALALSDSGARVGLADADIFGPSVPVLLGCEGEQPEVVQIEGKNCLVPIQRYGLSIMSMGMLVPADQAIVWRGPMASTALKQIIGSTQWGELDYLILDLPPGTSDIPLTISQQFALSGVVIVSTPQQVALADVRKSIAMFLQDKIEVKILGLVENMAYFATEKLPGERFYLFGKGGATSLAEEKGLEVLGELPLYESMSSAADTGLPFFLKYPDERAPWIAISQRIAQEVSKHNATLIADAAKA